jgi:hypothetical protein
MDRRQLMARYAPRLLDVPTPRHQNQDVPFDAPIPDLHAETARRTDTQAPLWTPVVTDTGSRTIITGAATVERAAMWGAPPNPNQHLLWMQGRFVGADQPNRNGALWSSGDLELGRATVAHGPLNWLHQDRHVIGTIADAHLVPAHPSDQAASNEPTGGNDGGNDTLGQTHIAALSAIWRWIYPDEASVVQMASDAGCLAYSMECIAEKVECAGETGCGQSYTYKEYAQGHACDHLRDRASIRRLVNPTFLGGAVIVPPSRPGWADANATTLRANAAMAEKAFQQAGCPDIPTTTWEQMMASVHSFATDPGDPQT